MLRPKASPGHASLLTLAILVLAAVSPNGVCSRIAGPPAQAAAAPAPRQEAPFFDGASAFRLVEKQCAFGPRDPGSPGHAACLAFLTSELRRLSGRVERQEFSYAVPGEGKALALTNLVARFGPPTGDKILLCAHWDTRPWADRDPDAKRRQEPILGANDGASGVAVLLELARVFKQHPPPVPIELVLFDGEDLGTDANPNGFFRGSKHFAAGYRGAKPRHGILLDMVGDRDLQFKREGYSMMRAPATLNWLWAAGRKLAPDHFLEERGYWVLDDHVPLLGAGIPCVDLIDFDYPAWHTSADRLDQISPASLQVVGDVLLHLLYSESVQP